MHKEIMAAVGGIGANAATPETALDSIVGQVSHLEEALQGLRARIGSIAYKLDGPVPEPNQTGDNMKQPTPVGAISDLRARVRSCTEFARDLHNLADRLEQLI